jgi:hypothetical protein
MEKSFIDLDSNIKNYIEIKNSIIKIIQRLELTPIDQNLKLVTITDDPQLLVEKKNKPKNNIFKRYFRDAPN